MYGGGDDKCLCNVRIYGKKMHVYITFWVNQKWVEPSGIKILQFFFSSSSLSFYLDFYMVQYSELRGKIQKENKTANSKKGKNSGEESERRSGENEESFVTDFLTGKVVVRKNFIVGIWESF